MDTDLASQVARAHRAEQLREPLIPRRLQRLCYFAQGALYAAGSGTAMTFAAWPTGPVSRALYARTRGRATVDALGDDEPSHVVRDVVAVYGLLSASELDDECSRTPWRDAVRSGERDIDPERMRAYFTELWMDGVVAPSALQAGCHLDGIPYTWRDPSMSMLAQRLREARTNYFQQSTSDLLTADRTAVIMNSKKGGDDEIVKPKRSAEISLPRRSANCARPYTSSLSRPRVPA